jgi:hypothetical protein
MAGRVLEATFACSARHDGPQNFFLRPLIENRSISEPQCSQGDDVRSAAVLATESRSRHSLEQVFLDFLPLPSMGTSIAASQTTHDVLYRPSTTLFLAAFSAASQSEPQTRLLAPGFTGRSQQTAQLRITYFFVFCTPTP